MKRSTTSPVWPPSSTTRTEDEDKCIVNKADRMGPGGSCRPTTRTLNAGNSGTNGGATGNSGGSNDLDFEIFAYRTTTWRTIFFYIFSFGTCGIFRLILHWFPKLFIEFRAKRCSVQNANLVLVIDSHERSEICRVFYRNRKSTEHTVVAHTDGSLIEFDELRWFFYRKLQYTWIDGEWTTASRAFSSVTPENMTKMTKGLTDDDVALRQTYFGQNVMTAELTPFFEIVLKEILTPFYIFQAFSVTVWYIDDYVWYSTLIILMTSYSIILTLRQTRQQESRIRSMVVEHDEVEVLRDDGRVRTIDSSEVVPGDILIIPPQGCMLYCDCVLLNGSVIVNESMLTGESIPITKTAISDDGHEKYFSIDKHSKNVLFNGTKVLQTKYYKGQHVKALVIRTAYSTTKGQLVRSIMYPKPADFKFLTQLMKFVGVLSIVALFGFLYTAIVLIINDKSVWKVLIRALDLVTITVPPALPAVMSIGIYYAQKRLKKQSIYCISPTTINTCGAIDVVCFDKTGTLTEDGLDFYAVRMVDEKKCDLLEPVTKITSDSMCRKMELHGDPLDVILFEQTGFTLEDMDDDESGSESDHSVQPILVRPSSNTPDQTDMSIMKQFIFNSALQRMSVIVSGNQTLKAYCKGSPEMIVSLCKPDTVPENFHDIVEEYTQHGYRLIAVAEKDIENGTGISKISRTSVECDLELLGFVALENRLKPVTKEVIDDLNKANIRSIMVTGDNLLTALSVARECSIIGEDRKAYLIEHHQNETDNRGRPILTLRHSEIGNSRNIKCSDLSKLASNDFQFAISGPTFSVVSHEYPELLDQLVCVCNVFARMAPDQKQLLVEHLQTVGSTVAMCGDGANDCAALKAAHAGISLSDAEASIAAPFTSKIADIRCVITMIREGRAALVTSFSAFLCMAGYSLTQFISILLLYYIATSYSQMQFLYIDMPIVTLLAWLSSRAKAHTSLAPKPPPTSILSVSSMVSLFGQLAIGGFSQILVFCLITLQDFFVPFKGTHQDAEDERKSMQGTAIFYVSMFHYIVLYFIFAKGPPYRASFLSNRPFAWAILVITIVCIWVVTWSFTPVHTFLGCVEIPFEFRLIILAIAAVTAIISLIFDRFLDKISAYISEIIRQRRKRN
ncbi:unnamed protein product [Caenorhabditis angaria]|uniref:Cation-transporting ATPase n=1 Tax=Caenorhabditis angaria TaxID=860376 RepID=A0A9P1N1W5_9PELO|nr:unnamed protein product [Caenorhabditis angaria]